MPKFSFAQLNTVVKDMDGNSVKVNIENALSDLTVRFAFRRALNIDYKDEEVNPQLGKTGLPLEKRLDRYALSKKIWYSEHEGVSMTNEELKELKTVVGKAFAGETLGFLCDILDRNPLLGDINKSQEKPVELKDPQEKSE